MDKIYRNRNIVVISIIHIHSLLSHSHTATQVSFLLLIIKPSPFVSPLWRYSVDLDCLKVWVRRGTGSKDETITTKLQTLQTFEVNAHYSRMLHTLPATNECRELLACSFWPHLLDCCTSAFVSCMTLPPPLLNITLPFTEGKTTGLFIALPPTHVLHSLLHRDGTQNVTETKSTY